VLLVLGRTWLLGPTLVRAFERARLSCVGNPRTALLTLALFIGAWDVMVSLSQHRMLATDGTIAYLIAHGIDPYLRYLPIFFLGVLIRSLPDIRKAFVWRKGWEMPALALFTAICASLLRGRGGEGLAIAYEAMDGLASILMSFTVIGIAERFWNRPDARIDRIVDASFTIYLLHHPIIYGLATIFLLPEWPPLAEFTLICVVTFVLSYGAHRIIRRSSLALFLFNGVPIRRKPRGDTSPQGPITTLR
jgi:glucans biosynthesis protein C